MKKYLVIFSLFAFFNQANAQPYSNKVANTSEIYHKVQKLGTCGSVLYIAAHPDDENTRMLTYFARIRNMETSYLSLTRGDGGQNLIGTEQSEQLGLIRTQELLAARNIDGAKQYFTRALDFGFSKNPEETFTRWDKNVLLGDVVFFIRLLKPDVIITRFSPEPANTHGHHTGSAQLAVLAVEAAADETKFPEQLQFVETHKVASLYWNASWFHFGTPDFDKSGFFSLNIGEFNTQTGKWVGETAAESRSMHRSQGFGAAAFRGMDVEYLKPLYGHSAQSDIFENIDTSWDRVPGAKGFNKKVATLIKNFDFKNPKSSIKALINFRSELSKLPDSFYKNAKLKELDELILDCAGFYIEAVLPKAEFNPGETAKLKIQSFSNMNDEITWSLKGKSIGFLSSDIMSKDSIEWTAPIEPSNPYWLKKPVKNSFFQLENPYKELLNPGVDLYTIPVVVNIYGLEIIKNIPLVYKYVKPELGECFEYPIVLAPIQVKTSSELYITHEDYLFPEIELLSSKDFDMVDIQVFQGEKVVFNKKILNVKKGEKRVEKLSISTLNMDGNMNNFTVRVVQDGEDIGLERIRIEYPHIPTQVWQRPLSFSVVKLDQKVSNKRIAYIDGAGDKVMDILKLAGYNIDLLKPSEYNLNTFKKYDVIITGIRAYNTNKELINAQSELKKFIAEGGRLIVQYNTTASLLSKEIGPYPFQISRDRVTDEEAEVDFLVEHPILKGITKEDFNDWVQERGLYYPSKLSTEYVNLLTMNDPGEEKNPNSLIYAKYGEGDFIYTGLSFFRQLPAGNKGALRLFIALIEN